MTTQTESVSSQSPITVGEIRAWLTAELGRIKSDIENIYSITGGLEQSAARTDARLSALAEIAPIMQGVRERLALMEAQLKGHELRENDSDAVSELELEKFKRENDAAFNKIRVDFSAAVTEAVKPVAKDLGDLTKTVTDLDKKVMKVIVQVSIIAAVLAALGAKGLDFLLSLVK